MPYIGRDLNRGNYLKLDDISSSFNSSTTTFNLTVGGSAFTPGSAFSILVSIGGVIQEPESAYQVNNSEITFANAPTAQDSFFCIALAVPLGIGVPGNGTVNGAHLAKPFNYDGYFYLDDANNRVGIGSLTPTVALDVIGNTNISGIVTATSFSGNITGNIIGNVNAASGISTFYDLRVSNNLTVEGTTSTLDTTLIGVDRVEVGANSNSIVGVAVTQSGTADLVNLFDGSTKVVIVDDVGNVGVGSAIPAATVDIQGLSSSYPILNLGGGGSANGDLTVNSGESLQVGHFNRSTSSFEERLRIANDGKVGIGSTIPVAHLDVAAYQNVEVLRLRDKHNNKYLTIRGSGSPNRMVIDSYEGGGGGAAIDLASNGSTKLRITSGGNIGIGSAIPLAKLETYQSGTTGYLFRAMAGLSVGNRPYDLKPPSSDSMTEPFSWNTGNSHAFQVDGVEYLRIADNGRVGIGSEIPAATLDLQSEDTEVLLRLNTRPIKNGYLDIVSDANRRGIIRFQDTDGTYRWSMGKGDSDELTNTSFFINAGNNGGTNADFVIDSNGDVGINVTNPGQKLHVDGSIKLTGQLMQSTPTDFWSQGNTFIELNGVGNLTHMGGHETNLTSNGYRDQNGQWVGYSAGSNGGAAQIGLKPTGSIVFRTDASKADGTAHNPTIRLVIDDEGIRSPGGVLNLKNSGSTGNILVNVLGVSGDSRIDLENTGNGNYSGIDFVRERSSGTGVVGGSIFMKSDTSSNNALLYLQAQSASAQSPVTTALSDDNGVRLILKGGDGIFSVEAGASEKLKVQTDGVLIGGHTRGTLDPSKLSVFDSSSNIGILQIHHSASGGGVETAGDLAGITFGHGGNGTTSRPKVAIASRATGAYGRGDLCFYVDGASDNNPVSAADERLRIKGDGQIYVGSDNTNFSDAGTFFNLKNDTYGGRIGFSNNTASAGATLMEQFAYWGTNKVAGFIALGGTDTTNKDDGELVFYTRYSGASVAEALRIAPNGELSISGVKSGNSIPDVSLKFNILDSNGNDKKATIAATKVGDINSELIFSTTVSHAFAERMKINSNGYIIHSGQQFLQSSTGNTVISTTRSNEGVVTALQSISNPVGRVGTTSNHSLEVVANNTPAFTVDTSGGILAQTKSFVSKFHYSATIQSTGGWSTNWNTIIPGGTLGHNDTYVISAYWQHNHNGGNAGSPYLMQASFLYSSVSTNNTTGGNVEFVPFQTAHVGGGTHRLVFRFLPVGGHTTAAVQVKNPAGFHADYGGITVKAHVLSDY